MMSYTDLCRYSTQEVEVLTNGQCLATVQHLSSSTQLRHQTELVMGCGGTDCGGGPPGGQPQRGAPVARHPPRQPAPV